MGMLDSEAMFSDGQAVTSTGDTPSTNVYDTGGTNGQGDLGMLDESLWLNIRAATALTSGGSATIAGVLQVSDDNSTWTDLVVGTATAVASVVAGYDLLRVQPPPVPSAGPSRYYRTVTRVAVAALTGGTIDSYFSNAIQRNISRLSGFTVPGI